MNTMDAVMNVEIGECDEDTYIASMQHLIDTAIVWRLQGFFGRRAVELIEAGVCTAPDWVDINE
mgnify:CR=1 FL=1|jgi:hypothetical protein